jgi:hypothetical protein
LIVRNNERRVQGEAQRVCFETRLARDVQRRALAAEGEHVLKKGEHLLMKRERLLLKDKLKSMA